MKDGGESVTKTRKFKIPLINKTVTRTKTIGPDGTKTKTTSFNVGDKSISRTKTKYKSGYKEKTSTMTAPGAKPGSTDKWSMKKEKGLNPKMGTKTMTDRGMYRRKMKTATSSRTFEHGTRERLNQKLKENLDGFKQRQHLRRETAANPTGSIKSQVGMYKRVNPGEFIKRTTYKKGGQKEMIKRADGSYSQRGLWDNIRANKGSGKKPTAQMLKQERKIKAKSK